jgi:hypothetical protein
MRTMAILMRSVSALLLALAIAGCGDVHPKQPDGSSTPPWITPTSHGG